MKYLYDISGGYAHEPSEGVFNEGQFSGSAVIYDEFNEITESAHEYDEWFIYSYEFNAGGYEFSGKNGKIKRFISSNSLVIDNPEWGGESEAIFIVTTGPGAIPLERFSFSVPNSNNIELDDGTIIHFHGITFENRQLVNPCPPIFLFSKIWDWLRRLFGK